MGYRSGIDEIDEYRMGLSPANVVWATLPMPIIDGWVWKRTLDWPHVTQLHAVK